jgi:hypothetical protein
MARLRFNNALGLLGAPLSAASPGASQTIDFGATVPPFATLVAPDYIPIVLEPPSGQSSVNFEIVYLTAYTAGQTTGTILRGQENTPAPAHAASATWVCGATIQDFSRQRYSLTTLFSGLTTAIEAGGLNITAPSKGCLLYAVTVDQPCRFRIYATAAQAAADLSRSQSVDPTGNHGCLLEVVMLAAGPLVLSPSVMLVEQDGTPSQNFPCNVRCDSGSTLNVTLTGYREET